MNRPTILSRPKFKNQLIRWHDHYQCGECSTVFREEDLAYDIHHGELLGTHTYKPEAYECPFCGAAVLNNNPATIDLGDIPSARYHPKECRMIPRTVEQNCISPTMTIKPQIDWEKMDVWFEMHGIPCPVPTAEDLENITV